MPTFEIALKNALLGPTAFYCVLLGTTSLHFCPHIKLDSVHVKRKRKSSKRKLWKFVSLLLALFRRNRLCLRILSATTFGGVVVEPFWGSGFPISRAEGCLSRSIPT